jgi:SagB-type dehydrogenase family enzyme
MAMKRSLFFILLLCLTENQVTFASEHGQPLKLPEPETRGDMSVEQAIGKRRSLRHYNGSLALADVSQLLWAAQGETHPDGYRATPSAGALYPLEVYLVVGNVAGLSVGVYRYRPAEHDLIQLGTADLRKELDAAAYGQSFMQDAAAVLVITGVYERTRKKYGRRARRYVHMEVGHAAENVYLQAEARGLGTLVMGAFDDERVQAVLGLPDDHEPLGLMPLGPR